MSVDLANFDVRARESVQRFWRTRQTARDKQIASGRKDQGERASVTAGKNMDGFLSLIRDVIHANGLQGAEIHQQRAALTLPGFFRPTKLWDLLVLYQGELVAAIELKSHVGPSFGNNFNNRTEEAIGTAHDLWTAYREGAFGQQPKPYVGWIVLVERCEKSCASVRDKSPHFPVFEEFQGASYLKRYDLLCQKLVQEQLYTSASLIAAPKESIETGEYTSFSNMTSLKTFISTLAGHVAATAARFSP